MVSSDEVRLVKRVNGFAAWVESVRKERGTEEARRLVISAWIDYHVSLGRVYGLGDIARALEGTSDFERFKSAPSAIPCQFTLAELIAAGVSDEGITRVIVQAKPLDSSYNRKAYCWCQASGLCLVASKEEFDEYQRNLEKRGGNDA
ncbi:hypothetical protein CYK25_005500 [Varibaculum cambriense]|nr:hypothetical protein CYK25_005500 [Varibaculum cambriense]